MIGGIDIGLASRRLIIFLWSIVILAAVWLIRRPGIAPQRRSTPEGNSPDPAQLMLKELYAQGAITKEQFKATRRDLDADHRPDRSS